MNKKIAIDEEYLKILFINWLMEYETGHTERWSGLVPREWQVLAEAQWPNFQRDLVRIAERTPP